MKYLLEKLLSTELKSLNTDGISSEQADRFLAAYRESGLLKLGHQLYEATYLQAQGKVVGVKLRLPTLDM